MMRDRRKLTGVSNVDTTTTAIKLCRMLMPKNTLEMMKIATNKATAIA